MILKHLYVSRTLNNEKGIVLIIAMIMLFLLTIIGVAAIDTSTLETIISGVEKDRQAAFYTAEAGVEHIRGLLTTLFVSRNAAKLAAGGTPDWDFALNGSESGISAATGTNYAGGSVWITNGAGGTGYTYNVRIWNNADSGTAINDTDGTLYVRSDATGQGGSSASVEVSLQGLVSSGGSISGYTAQAGAGSAKSYTGDDMNAITTFTKQL